MKNETNSHTKPLNEGWEKELDDKFGHIQIFKEWNSRGEKYGGIKTFVRSLLLSEREHIVREIDGVKKEVSPIHFPNAKDGNYYNGFESGKELVLGKIDALKDKIMGK